ncbi:MAG: hypothetical protein ABI619_13010 [Betaproteobacteria bacterium]
MASRRPLWEMVGRKLKQLYRATPYFSFALQERGSGKRRDDRYLFAALTNPELLIPWLRGIEANGMPVSGIYPLALVSASLIERLKLKQPNLLIVSKNSAGLRQTFFKNLKFRISRLTPLRADAEVADQHYADEIGNTRMYLDALTVTHVDDTLELVILDLDGSLSGLPSAIMRGRPNVQCQYLKLDDVHRQFGIPIADLEISPDVLHLYLLGEQTPNLNLAPPHLKRTFQRFAAGRWVYAASGAMLLGAIALSGVNVYRAMGIDQNAVLARQKTAEYQSKYQQVTAQFPDAPTTADNLRHTVEIAEQIRAGLRTPDKMLALVSHALDASPGIQLQRIEWHYGDAPPSRLSVKRAPDVENGRLQRGIIYGAIGDFAGDYRAAMTAINNFARGMAQNDEVMEVKALKLPLDVRSEAGLNGSTAAVPGKETAQFELLVVLKKGA